MGRGSCFLEDKKKGQAKSRGWVGRGCMFRGSWVLGRGCWVMGGGSWVVGGGSWVVGRRSWVVGRVSLKIKKKVY